MTTPPPPLPVPPDTSTATVEALIHQLQDAARTARTGGQLYDDAANALALLLSERDALAARETRLRAALDELRKSAVVCERWSHGSSDLAFSAGGKLDGYRTSIEAIERALLVSSAPTSTEAGP